MSKRNSIVTKVPPEFKEWVEKRRLNMQKMMGLPVRLSKMDTMRIIAKTEGVDLTPELIKRMRRLII